MRYLLYVKQGGSLLGFVQFNNLSGVSNIVCILKGHYQYCGHFFDFERVFVRLKFVSDYLSIS